MSCCRRESLGCQVLLDREMRELNYLVTSPIDDRDETRAYRHQHFFWIFWTPICIIVFFGKVGTSINYDNKFKKKMKMKKSRRILNRLPSVRYQIHRKIKEMFSIMDRDYGPSVRI